MHAVRATSFLTATVDQLAARIQPAATLLTRLVLGQAFVATGLGKWRNFDATADFFARSGIPAATANAAFIATIELLGGICLIAGLGTRLFAALLASTMVVALATADRASLIAALQYTGDRGLTDITALVFLLLLCWLWASGGGQLSVDRLLSRRGKRPVAE